jgi:hypothetical protein
MRALVEFLTARLAEDEQIARAASVRPSSPNCEGDAGEWRVADRHGDAEIITGGVERDNSYGGRGIFGSWNVVRYDGGASLDEGEHIARHDPARVLREVESKRRIVEWASTFGYTKLLEELALPYRDHPDFDPAWSE